MKISIIQNSITDYSVVIPHNPHKVEQTAARELVLYFKKVYGVELSVESEALYRGKAIYVGHTAYAYEAGISAASKENWIIKMHGDNLVLTGGTNGGDRGVLYSVYHFIEDVMGVRWWNRWKEYVPSSSELALDSDMCSEGTPAFSYRKILSHKRIDDFFYEARNRGNVIMEDDGLDDEAYNESLKALGGAKHMARPGHVHSLPLYCPPDEYFEKHPEWFAWSDAGNKRVSYGHYCLTNEEFFEYILQKLTAYIEEDMTLAKEAGIETPCFYSISFPDVIQGFCQCEKCKALEQKGGASGYALSFVNRLARAVGEKYPHVKIETLMYSLYIDPPKDDTIPEKNVIIRLAQVYVDIIHNIHAKGNRWYLSLLEAWSAICKKAGCELYIWEYMYNLFFDFPMPIACRLSDTFKTFYDCGVSGIFVENQGRTTCLWELNQYMLLHLCENPYADEEYLIEDFMTKFYGKAQEHMKAYLYELKAAAYKNEYSSFCIIEGARFNYLDAETVVKCHGILCNAAEAVKDNEYLSLRVMWEQKLLNALILVKFEDLKNMAEREGIEFRFKKEELLKDIISALNIAINTSNFTNYPESLEDELRFYEAFDISSNNADIPKELINENRDDIYQYHFKDSCRHFHDSANYGFSIVEDPDSSLGKAARMCGEEARFKANAADLLLTSKYAENPKPLSLTIEQNSKIVGECGIYREDIVPNEYKLYKIGAVSGIKESADTRVNIFGLNYEWVSLTGLSVVFPMDTCEVYISLKFTGALYGGSQNDKDAIFTDRLIVVRKEKENV